MSRGRRSPFGLGRTVAIRVPMMLVGDVREFVEIKSAEVRDTPINELIRSVVQKRKAKLE